jgi:hypothetical protein
LLWFLLQLLWVLLQGLNFHKLGFFFHYTTPTCYGFCCSVWVFTSWGFSPLHNSYLSWFLLLGLSFYNLRFGSINIPTFFFKIIGF